MDEPRSRQARFNAASGDQWEGFADHRRRVSALLGVGSKSPGGRLCVLGAGNANDLDLAGLLEAHREVHLVDVDPEALDRGVNGQGVADQPRLVRHGGVDLTGMLDALGGWSPTSKITDPDLAALVDWPARRVGLALPGPFDVVASTCLLSQIIGNAFVSIGEGHPRFFEVARAIRLGHLRLLIDLVRPGGRIVLINDVVSSERCPELISIPEPELPAFLEKLTTARGLIHGMNPATIRDLFRRDPVIAPKVAGLEASRPWRWRLHRRQYLVWGLTVAIR